MRSVESKQQRLADIGEAEERWFRRIKRAINALDKLRAERKRLTARRKLSPEELEPQYGKAKTKLPMGGDFNDNLNFLGVSDD